MGMPTLPDRASPLLRPSSSTLVNASVLAISSSSTSGSAGTGCDKFERFLSVSCRQGAQEERLTKLTPSTSTSAGRRVPHTR